MDWKKIKFFNESEFKCNHCGKCEMDEEFMLTLDSARDDARVPFKINSGYRCDEHDKAEGGKGNHNTGKAADIAVASSRQRYLILSALIEMGFQRIGIGQNFIHVDSCTDEDGKPTEVVWLY